MNNEINESLSEELIRQIGDLSSFETGTREMDNAIENVVKLYNLLSENDKLLIESKKLGIEKLDVMNQMAEQKKERRIKLITDILGIGVPLVFNCFWLIEGMHYEKTGTFSSKTVNWLISHFKSCK